MATAQVLPREVRLVPPPTVPQARSYLFKQQSTQGTYTAGSNTPIQINIPRLQRSYLSKDSYLKFRLKVTGSALTSGYPCYFDQPGAFGLFSRIEIYDYLGSTLLESIDGTNVLMALLMNCSTSPSELAKHYNVCSGMQEDESYMLHDGSNTTITHEFSIPLFSFLGMLSSKFAPLHNGYTIMLTMDTKANFARFSPKVADAIAIGTDTVFNRTDEFNIYSFELNNVYFCAQILELGPVAESMLLSSSQGAPLVVNSKAFRHYTNTVPATSSSVRVDLNLNVASLTNVLFTQRDQAYQPYTCFKSLSQFVRNYLESWYFQYGSSILPQTQGIACRAPGNQQINFFGTESSIIPSGTGVPTTPLAAEGGSSEAYMELLKARHALNSANFDSLIDQSQYNVDEFGALWGGGVPVYDALDKIKLISNSRFVGNTGTVTNAGVTTTVFTGNPADKTLTMKDWIVAYPKFGKTKFACGLDLEVVSGKSGDLVCGMNTNGMNTSILLNFDSDYISKVRSTLVDVWCEYDSFVNISPGIATTVSF